MINIYGLAGCAPCQNAKRLSLVKKIEYRFIEITTDEIKEQVKAKAGLEGNITVPQIFNDDEYIGGFKEYKEWVKTSNG